MSDNKKLGLAGAAMIAVALLSLYVQVRELQNHYAAPSWPTTKGRVTRAWQEKTSWLVGLFSRSAARVEYTYEVGSKRFTGNTISFLADEVTDTGDESAALGAALAYALVRDVTVHYDPASPGTSCLLTSGPLRVAPLVLMAAFVLLLGGLGVLLVVLAREPAAVTHAAPRAQAPTSY